MARRESVVDDAQRDTDLTRALTRLGWVREDDVQPKGHGEVPWPYLSNGDWRCLIGTMGWATIYRKDENGIHDMQSRRTERLDDVVQLARSVA